MVFGLGVSDADVDLSLQFNGDTGLNYRRYRMVGSGASASASAGDSEDSIVLNEMRRSAYPTLAIIKITGDSSDERYVDALSSGTTNSNTRIGKYSFYWKDTLDNLDEITVRGEFSGLSDATIALFATPKGINTENWELVEEVTVTAQDLNTSPIQFQNLDGDSHKQYLIDVDLEYTASEWLYLRYNGDTGVNYTTQQLRNVGGSIGAQNNNDNEIRTLANDQRAHKGTIVVNAETGQKRLCTISIGSNGSGSTKQGENAGWWDNTVDNLDEIELSTLTASSATGTARLYKKKNPNTVADRFNLPFKLIKEVDVSGDFSAGHTFSGLEGNKVLMYKLEYLGEISTGGRIRVQFNGDSGSNYDRQLLRGQNSSTTASSTSNTYAEIVGSNDKVSYSTLYIFPQSGENRPCLSDMNFGENTKEFDAFWWTNSADEIDEIKVFNSTTNTTTGTLRLSAIPLPDQKSTTGQAVEFNGSTESLDLGSSAQLILTDDFLYNIWVYNTSSSSYDCLFARYQASGNQRSFVLRIDQTTNVLTAVTSITGSSVAVINGPTIPLNTWTMVTCRMTGGTIYLSINNGTETTAAQSTLYNNTGISTTVGDNDDGDAFPGSLAFAYILNSGADIREELYNNGTPIQPWLTGANVKDNAVCLLPLNSETSSNEFNDYSGNSLNASLNGSPAVDGQNIQIITSLDPGP